MLQAEEIRRVNARLERGGVRLRILHGLEMNLSPQGEGDMDPVALRALDLVLGAFHSKLRVTDDQTERYLAALRNPIFHVLAHPRGRRWGARTSPARPCGLPTPMRDPTRPPRCARWSLPRG